MGTIMVDGREYSGLNAVLIAISRDLWNNGEYVVTHTDGSPSQVVIVQIGKIPVVRWLLVDA
jgi:hypothetical protein